MRATFLLYALAALLVVSCGGTDFGVQPDHDTDSGTVLAYVYWDGQGLSDMRIEIVELGIEMKTDADGVAEFEVPPGEYTLRAWDINQPGPPPPYVDKDISVEADKTTRVDIANCLPCV